MKNLVFLLLSAILICSCSSTNLVFISVKEPAPVSVPNYIKSVAIINRSKATEENKMLDDIHRVLSLESKKLLEEGGKASIEGLNDEMIANNRFENIVKLDTTELRAFGAGVFPSALSWDQVEKICVETSTDVLFALELFDADSKLSYGATPANINTIFGKVPAIESTVTMSTVVKTGWRMYDPHSRIILDESLISKELIFTGRGINPIAATEALIHKKEAVKQAGNAAGHLYAEKIDPYWIRVSRDYFVRGSTNFKTAKRKAQTGNWKDAGKLWEQETTNSKRKVAGRACYNMAIINEINGDIDSAIQWAQKAYEDYRIKIALHYVNILQNRKAKDALLTMQTNPAK